MDDLEVIKCSKCSGQYSYTNIPKSLPCDDTICSDCLPSLQGVCPVCQTPFKDSEVKDNKLALKMIEILNLDEKARAKKIIKDNFDVFMKKIAIIKARQNEIITFLNKLIENVGDDESYSKVSFAFKILSSALLFFPVTNLCGSVMSHALTITDTGFCMNSMSKNGNIQRTIDDIISEHDKLNAELAVTNVVDNYKRYFEAEMYIRNLKYSQTIAKNYDKKMIKSKISPISSQIGLSIAIATKSIYKDLNKAAIDSVGKNSQIGPSALEQIANSAQKIPSNQIIQEIPLTTISSKFCNSQITNPLMRNAANPSFLETILSPQKNFEMFQANNINPQNIEFFKGIEFGGKSNLNFSAKSFSGDSFADCYSNFELLKENAQKISAPSSSLIETAKTSSVGLNSTCSSSTGGVNNTLKAQVSDSKALSSSSSSVKDTQQKCSGNGSQISGCGAALIGLNVVISFASLIHEINEGKKTKADLEKEIAEAKKTLANIDFMIEKCQALVAE